MAGSNLMWAVSFSGLARVDQTPERCQVGNEWVASRLAMSIGLPVPPGGLLDLDDRLGYVMMRFGADGMPPPVTCDEFVDLYPEVAAGAVVFDLWIGNNDRTEYNLAVDGKIGRPILFDHEKAFGDGYRDRLRDIVGWTEEVDVFVPHDLDLCVEITEHRHLGPWVDRITRLDPEQIKAPCVELHRLGYLQKQDADAMAEFLLERRHTYGHCWRTCA